MYLCVDIGTNAIKVLEKSSDGKILRWGILERSKPFHSNIVPLEEKDAAGALKILLDKMRVEAAEAVAVLPDFLTFTMIAENSDPENIPAAPGTFHFQAFPLTPENFFLSAVPKDVIEKYARIFQNLNLKIKSLEMESFVLARVLGKSARPTLIINSRKGFTSLVVAKDGFPDFVSKTDFGIQSGRDVIINKAKEIAEKKSVQKIVAVSPWDIVKSL